jgi:poly(hydroxyalkanoate) granule-associated protein
VPWFILKEILMIKKIKPTAPDTVSSDSQLASAVKASAQQIWLAGLGAFAKAQEEGVKVFDALVSEGKTLHKRTRHMSDGRLEEVTGKVGQVATGLTKQATQSWDRLEQVFEERVARAMSKLGVPTSAEVKALSARVEALNEAVRALGAKPVARASTRTSTTKSATKSTKATAAKAPEKAPAKSAARKASPRATPVASKVARKVSTGRK